MPPHREKKELAMEKRRIAVLPFQNMSPDPSDEFFADGMTEEIISTLSRIEGAEIISRTSVMQYKTTPKPVKEISMELNVGTVLAGSVRKAGNKMRVAVQMIDAALDRNVWTDSYDRQLEDVFAVQSDIAGRVAEALQTRMRTGLRMLHRTPNIEAYSLYLRGMQLYYENTEASMREAVSLFEKAISKDARFLYAYTGLAYALSGLAVGYEDFSTTIAKAEAAARKAVQLQPDSAEALVAMAHVHIFTDKLDDVVAEAEKAIEINPNLCEGYRSLGWIYASRGELDRGLVHLERAFELDPMSFRPGTELTTVLQFAGREQEALQFLERLRDLYPKSHRVYARYAEFYIWKGDFVKAQDLLKTGLALSPRDVDLLTDQGLVYAFTDRKREAIRVLTDIANDAIEESRLQGQLFIGAALGSLDEPFSALMRLAQLHSWPPLIKTLPVFEEMRRDPRFIKFCKQVGLQS